MAVSHIHHINLVGCRGTVVEPTADRLPGPGDYFSTHILVNGPRQGQTIFTGVEGIDMGNQLRGCDGLSLFIGELGKKRRGGGERFSHVPKLVAVDEQRFDGFCRLNALVSGT